MASDATLAQRLAAIVDGHRLLDLSVTLDEALPCSWPTHMPFQHKTYTWFQDRPDPAAPVINRSGAAYQTRWLLIDEHTGTHCDAPSHFIPPPGSGLPQAGDPGALDVAQLPLAQLMGPAAVVDVTDLAGEGTPGHSPLIERRHLNRFEERHGRFEPGDVVLLRSDWDRHYLPGPEGDAYARDALVTASGPGWPSPSADAIDLLFERGVRCVGTDGPSIGGSDSGRAPHVAGLSRGMTYVELLQGLGRLPARGAHFLFLPLKIAQGTGGPGRAVAIAP